MKPWLWLLRGVLGVNGRRIQDCYVVVARKGLNETRVLFRDPTRGKLWGKIEVAERSVSEFRFETTTTTTDGRRSRRLGSHIRWLLRLVVWNGSRWRGRDGSRRRGRSGSGKAYECGQVGRQI